MSRIGGTISRVYAAALFERAAESGQLEERVAEVRALMPLFGGEHRMRGFIESPRVDRKEKEKLLLDVFGPDVSADLRNLILLLLRRNRIFFTAEIFDAFIALYEEAKGQLRATVTTAKPLEDEEAARMAEILSKNVDREILLERDVDPELMGGAVLRYGDYIVDGSLRTRTRKMRESLLETSDQQGS